MRLIAKFKKSNQDHAKTIKEIQVDDAISELIENYQNRLGDTIHQNIDAYLLRTIGEDPGKIKFVPKKFSFSLRTIRENLGEEGDQPDHEAEESKEVSIKFDHAPVETEQQNMLNDSLEPKFVMVGSPSKPRVDLTQRSNFIQNFLDSDL